MVTGQAEKFMRCMGARKAHRMKACSYDKTLTSWALTPDCIRTAALLSLTGQVSAHGPRLSQAGAELVQCPGQAMMPSGIPENAPVLSEKEAAEALSAVTT